MNTKTNPNATPHTHTALLCSIPDLLDAYTAGAVGPREIVEAVFAAIERRDAESGVRNAGNMWISLKTKEEVLRYIEKEFESPTGKFFPSDGAETKTGGYGESVAQFPLFGVPLAVKDNFDVAGLATTCACPGFAYPATATAACVQKLLDAGAVLIGKTNLDQFAAGLVGTRSPYGVCENSIDLKLGVTLSTFEVPILLV